MDKIIHMIVFGVLTYLGCYYFTGKGKTVNTAAILSLLPALFYGTAIEFLQMFIPQRGFDFADLTADAIGTILGVFLFRTMSKRIGQTYL